MTTPRIDVPSEQIVQRLRQRGSVATLIEGAVTEIRERRYPDALHRTFRIGKDASPENRRWILDVYGGSE